jgi:hypothetical protein
MPDPVSLYANTPLPKKAKETYASVWEQLEAWSHDTPRDWRVWVVFFSDKAIRLAPAFEGLHSAPQVMERYGVEPEMNQAGFLYEFKGDDRSVLENGARQKVAMWRSRAYA